MIAKIEISDTNSAFQLVGEIKKLLLNWSGPEKGW